MDPFPKILIMTSIINDLFKIFRNKSKKSSNDSLSLTNSSSIYHDSNSPNLSNSFSSDLENNFIRNDLKKLSYDNNLTNQQRSLNEDDVAEKIITNLSQSCSKLNISTTNDQDTSSNRTDQSNAALVSDTRNHLDNNVESALNLDSTLELDVKFGIDVKKGVCYYCKLGKTY